MSPTQCFGQRGVEKYSRTGARRRLPGPVHDRTAMVSFQIPTGPYRALSLSPAVIAERGANTSASQSSVQHEMNREQKTPAAKPSRSEHYHYYHTHTQLDLERRNRGGGGRNGPLIQHRQSNPPVISLPIAFSSFRSEHCFLPPFFSPK